MSQQLSRRRFLGHVGIAGLGIAGLSACDVSTDTGNEGDNADDLGFRADDIPDGEGIPEDDISIGWMDSGDLKAMFEEPFFAAYQEKYPNITVDYQPSSWDVINEAIPVAVRNDSAPDVFAIPNNVPVQVAVNDGWVKPIDDVVPNFDDFAAGFPEGSFIEGVHVFEGKTYAWPMNSSKRDHNMLFFHPPYLGEAGFNPREERLTWSTFREAATKITQNGNGDYYGWLLSADEISDFALVLAMNAGATIMGSYGGAFRGLDLTTGEFTSSAPEVIEAFELILAMKDEKVIFPGTAGLDDATSRARFPEKIAGLFFDGPWAIPQWPEIDPDFEFDIAMAPTGDDGQAHTVGFWETGANFAFVAASTQNDAVIGDMFTYLGSVEGQANIVVASQGNLASVIPEANERASESAELDANAVKAQDVANEGLRQAPDPRVRNPDVSQVILEMVPPSPDFKFEIGQGIFTGQMDAASALKSYDDAQNKALDDAIAAAQGKGASVSRADFVFPNWDIAEDYAPELYDEL